MNQPISSQYKFNNKMTANLTDKAVKTGNISSKAFFTNIKAELSNIRTDVNKLVKGKNQQSANKSIHLSRTNNLSTNGGLTQEKPCLDSTVNMQVRRMSTGQCLDGQPTMKVIEPRNLENELNQIRCQLNRQRQDSNMLRNALNREKELKQNLQTQIRSLIDSNLTNQQHKAYEHEIQNLTQKLRSSELIRNEQQQQIIELTNVKLTFSEQLNSLSSLKRANIDSQQQIGRLTSKLGDMTIQVSSLSEKLEVALRKSEQAVTKLQETKKSKTIEIQLLKHQLQNCQNQKTAMNMKDLGEVFQTKINDLLNENYALKNKITHLESNLQHSQFQMRSLQLTLSAFEERDKEMGKDARESQMENLHAQITQLQEQIDKMQSQHEFDIMKLENEIDEIKYSKNSGKDDTPVNQILKDQITEIENLRAKLKQKR